MADVIIPGLRQALAKLAAFRTYTGTASEAAAAARILMRELSDDESELTRPYVLLMEEGEVAVTPIGVDTYADSGEIAVVLFGKVATLDQDDVADAYASWRNDARDFRAMLTAIDGTDLDGSVRWKGLGVRQLFSEAEHGFEPVPVTGSTSRWRLWRAAYAVRWGVGE